METLERGTLTNRAAVTGAILGLVSGSYTFISFALSSVQHPGGGIAIGLLSPVLWIAKFVGCILIMRWAMQKLVASYEGVTNGDTLALGLASAAFSALITAAAGYVAMEYVFPEAVSAQLDQVYQMYGKFLDSNSMSMMDKMVESYSMISFFSSLIWCFIYGAVLSKILSNRIPERNPFAEMGEEPKDKNVDEQ